MASDEVVKLFIFCFIDCCKLYRCDECHQICLTISSLEKHKLLHSKKPKERSHKCPECDAVFTQKAYLKRHSVVHTGIKEFECDICHRMFARQREYIQKYLSFIYFAIIHLSRSGSTLHEFAIDQVPDGPRWVRWESSTA